MACILLFMFFCSLHSDGEVSMKKQIYDCSSLFMSIVVLLLIMVIYEQEFTFFFKNKFTPSFISYPGLFSLLFSSIAIFILIIFFHS